ncbi:MAG: PEGA domain-containing protein [bacterium]|nr:PEGA domain-containing protein [bacterium]
MKKAIALMTIFVLVITTTGCATILTDGRGKFEATSEPAGAEVYVNGEKMGQTPVTLLLKKKGEYRIVLKKEGFKEQTFKLTNKVGVGWIVLDVLCGLVPVIVDAVTGKWYRFNEKNFNAVLKKQKQ